MAKIYHRQFLLVAVPLLYMLGCETNELLHKAYALFQLPIQHKVYVGIHQGKGQDDNLESQYRDIYAVHGTDIVVLVIEHRIQNVSVCVKVPALVYPYRLSLDKWNIKPEIPVKLCEQFIIDIHLSLIRRP